MERPSRRQFLQGSLALAGVGLLTSCGLTAPPMQAPAKIPQVGVLIGLSGEAASARTEALRQGLREHGYTEGQNITLEWRFLDGRAERAPEFVNELLGLGVAVLVTGNVETAQAARQATSTVPIVLAGVGNDAVAIGLVANLQRPGGNVTGLSLAVPTLLPKRLQLLKETAPWVDRIGALWDSNLGPAVAPRLKLMEEAGSQLGVEVRPYWVLHSEELEPTFATMQRDGIGAVHVVETPLTVTHAGRIAGLALQHRLPAMYGTPEFARAGGLMALGVDQPGLYRRAATYVDKILKGANPGDLPVEQPTKFDFSINLQAAQALGLTIPPSVLQQATELIQ
jgi:putative ABC transport system substrate-binding protein